MEGHALISPDVLARYAADAARDVAGVIGLGDGGGLHRTREATARESNGTFSVEVPLELEWGRSAADVGAAVQRSVTDYLERMAAIVPTTVDVVVVGMGAPPAK
jgi:uncharacterized alkaline shock family protein YloU